MSLDITMTSHLNIFHPMTSYNIDEYNSLFQTPDKPDVRNSGIFSDKTQAYMYIEPRGKLKNLYQMSYSFTNE